MQGIKCPREHEIHCLLTESICLNVTFSQGSKGERGFPGLAGEKGDEVKLFHFYNSCILI